MNGCSAPGLSMGEDDLHRVRVRAPRAAAVARIRSFAPVAAPNARILILGSMPGAESLRARQYYAHPRNAFWPIMGELAGAAPALPYARRIEALERAGIALWDVLQSCTRTGSLDAGIDDDSVVANDFRRFFLHHRGIRQVFFNGAKAEACYRAHVLPGIDRGPPGYRRLPSTSPAHAALSWRQKLAAWREICALPVP